MHFTLGTARATRVATRRGRAIRIDSHIGVVGPVRPLGGLNSEGRGRGRHTTQLQRRPVPEVKVKVRPSRIPRLGSSVGSEAIKVGGSVGGVDGSRRGLLRPRERHGSRITAAAGNQLVSLGGSATREEGAGGRTMFVADFVVVGIFLGRRNIV